MSSKATPSSTSWATRAPYAGYSYASDSTPLRTNPPHWGQLSNRAPKGPLKRWLWEKAQWVEATFALSVIEPWEKLLVLSIVAIAWGLFSYSIYHYRPSELRGTLHRVKYYLTGNDEGIQAPL